MTPNDDDSPDELTRAYRAASERDAGRPPDAVRAAILANARHEAGKRTPAANDGRFWWRAVAGVAMLGVAVLIWRQVDPNVVRDATVQETGSNEAVVTSERDTTAEAPAPAPAPAPPPPPAGPPPRSPPEVLRELRQAPEARAANPAQAYVPEPPSMPAPAAMQAQSQTQDRAQSLAKAAPPPAIEAAERSMRDLLQREFPEEYEGATSAIRLWLIRDVDGRTLKKGRLGPDDDITTFTMQVARENNLRLNGGFITQTVRNAHGAWIEIGIVTAER